VKLYLEWKYGVAPEPPPTSMDVDPSTETPSAGNTIFTIDVLDIYTLDASVMISCPDHNFLVEALVQKGYLGNTPIFPSLAISLKTLELFHCLRLRKSSFSMEAFAKVLCDLYSVSSAIPPLISY